MSDMSSISRPSLSFGSHDEFSHMSFEQYAKKIHQVIRSSLRDYARSIEVFRELEDKEAEETSRAKAKSYRNMVPMIMRISSAVIGGLTMGVRIFPRGTKSSFDWLSDKCPLISPHLFDDFIDKTKEGNFDFLKFGESLSNSLSVAEGIFKTGLDITGNYELAERTEIDAKSQKAKELGERRTREAQERHSESDELLQLLQQINREIADSIRSIARA